MSTQEDLLKLDNQVCFPLYALSREITNQYRPFLDELDLSYPQYLVMMLLWEYKKLTVSGICDKLMLDTGTLTPLLKRMEAKGLVLRQRNSSDERVVTVTLSDKGKALKKAASAIPDKMIQAMGLSIEELLHLKQITTKILNKTTQQ
ncbi:MAG: MarR family transcriptional regulator [Chitinophagaceae bacterium]